MLDIKKFTLDKQSSLVIIRSRFLYLVSATW
jgi:hypothetical protein